MTSGRGPKQRNGARSRKYWKSRERHARSLGGRELSERDRRLILGR